MRVVSGQLWTLLPFLQDNMVLNALPHLLARKVLRDRQKEQCRERWRIHLVKANTLSRSFDLQKVLIRTIYVCMPTCKVKINKIPCVSVDADSETQGSVNRCPPSFSQLPSPPLLSFLLPPPTFSTSDLSHLLVFHFYT